MMNLLNKAAVESLHGIVFKKAHKRLKNKMDWVSLASCQPFGSIPRDCNSLRKTRFIQVAKEVSPSDLAASSNWARNSSGSRIWYGGERFSDGVDMVITLIYYHYMVITIVIACTHNDNAPPASEAQAGRLTKVLLGVTAMANADSTTFARPEFTGFINPVSFPAGADAAPDDLLTRPLNGGDLLTLAPVCAELVAWLLETPDDTVRLALTGRLSLALALLQDELEKPLTAAQRNALTTEQRQTRQPAGCFTESELTCNYCRTLTEILLRRACAGVSETLIAGLLFELVNHLADSLTAPRFYHAADGLRYLDDGSRVEAEYEHSCV